MSRRNLKRSKVTTGTSQPEPLGPGKLIREQTTPGAATTEDSHLDARWSSHRRPPRMASRYGAVDELHQPGHRIIDLDPDPSRPIGKLALRRPGATRGTDSRRLAHDPARQVEGVDAVLDDGATAGPRPIHLPMK